MSLSSAGQGFGLGEKRGFEAGGQADPGALEEKPAALGLGPGVPTEPKGGPGWAGRGCLRPAPSPTHFYFLVEANAI